MRKISSKIGLLAVLLCGLVLPANSFAWTDVGHKIVALIAWEDLTPATRAKVAEILKRHPRYNEDLLKDLPEGSSDDDAMQHAFAMAATWPDMVRQDSHPMHFVASHPSWHYIDIPYEIGGQKAPATRPSYGKGPKNVVEALAKNCADLGDADVSADDKAVALCWVVHLVGDIHQPLHTALLISSQFPDGDQGGNAMIVLRDPPFPSSRENLHLIWDSLPGQYKWEHIDNLIAGSLREDPQYARERFKDVLMKKDFMGWANESHALAVEYAYLNGTLKVAAAQDVKANAKTLVPGLPAGYIEEAEKISMRQLVLAGYRMADLLNSIFDGK